MGNQRQRINPCLCGQRILQLDRIEFSNLSSILFLSFELGSGRVMVETVQRLGFTRACVCSQGFKAYFRPTKRGRVFEYQAWLQRNFYPGFRFRVYSRFSYNSFTYYATTHAHLLQFNAHVLLLILICNHQNFLGSLQALVYCPLGMGATECIPG